MEEKKILITGATGNMGIEALVQLYNHENNYKLNVLSLPTKKDKAKLRPYLNDPRVNIIWGDLTKYEDVEKAVKNVNYVIHLGALVSPVADHNPKLAWKINFGGTKNIVDAIIASNHQDTTKLVFIGTIAETGNRKPPYHWGRIGDPILPSVFDYYAISKIAAEKYVMESQIKHWVSLRQTGIMHENLLEVNDGIAYHQPINNHLEWITAHDSGKMIVNLCTKDLPNTFWKNAYNIGGGEKCRLTAYELMNKMYGMMGVTMEQLEEPNWFATRNFHGHYYYDSDHLNDILDFRTQTVDDVIAKIKSNLPLAMKILKYIPKNFVKNKVQKKRALKQDTPLNWLKHNKTSKINAFLKSKEDWEKILGWDSFEIINNPEPIRIDHGYDDSLAPQDITFLEVQKAAAFRGGKCISENMETGDIYSKLKWKCAHNHEFEGSAYLILKAGHWCDKCIQTPWNFDEQAKSNPFIAQVWYHDHDADENNTYE